MISWFFIGLVITILFTPGPTNTLLASSGVQVGVRKSLLLIPAEALGYIVAITAWGMLIGKVSTALPLLPTFLKLMSAGYILYLAIKLWRTANQQVALNQPIKKIYESEDKRLIKIISSGWPFPIEMNYLDGKWKVDASNIIELRLQNKDAE